MRIVIAVMLFAWLPLASEAAWEIKQFEVFAGAPYQRSDGVIDVVGYDWAEAEDWFADFDRAEVERAFIKAAVWYSNNGFPEPWIEPVVQTDNGPAYRVYVCTEGTSVAAGFHNFGEWLKKKAGMDSDVAHWADCSSWGAYGGACTRSHGGRPVFYLNADGPAFRNGKLTVEGYQTVAHELFHAIQANTVMGKSPNPCDMGDWIIEGQADAVSIDLLDKIWPHLKQPSNDGWVIKKYGVRDYYNNLTQDKDGYFVSSWWRFLADINGGYDYLLSDRDGTPGLFDFEIREAGKWRSEAMWLDEGLYTKFNRRTNELLGLFMNDYAMRVAPLSWTSGDAEVDVPRWVKGVLGDCEEITLSDRKPSQVFSRNIAPMSGDCVWLTASVAQATTQVSLQVETDDPSVFRDVWIGLPRGNTVVSSAMVAGSTPSDRSKRLGIWANYTVPSGIPVLFTFANAADDPEKTKQRHVMFDISLSSWTNNLRGNAPAGPGKAAPPAQKPSYKKHTQTLQEKGAATSRMASEQKRLDKEVLSPNAAEATSVTLRPTQPACEEPFKYMPCGPYTSISLQLVPGTYLNLSLSAGSGGAASQVFSSFVGQATSNPFDAQSVMLDLAEKVESIDAAGVFISMPFIDYGYSGTINNASITTEIGGIRMRSVGPLDSTQQAPLIGSVRIDEYTPMGIRGSYSAKLAYFEPSPGPNQPPVYKTGPTLSGTFNQVAPWLSDSRVVPIQLQSQEEIADDIGKSLGVSASYMQKLKEQGVIPGVEGSSGSTSAGGGTVGPVECTCECAIKEIADELCALMCEEEFASCPD